MRLIASLAVVVGLMLLLARLVGKRYGARAGAPVQVLHRQPLSRSASVAVITVGSRGLVVGATDHQVRLLTALDPEELVDAELEAALAEQEGELEGEREIELTAELPLDLPARPDVAAAVPARTGMRTGVASLTSLPSLTALTQRTQRPGTSPRRTPAPQGTSTDGALSGSVLSAQTWRQAFAAATGKTS